MWSPTHVQVTVHRARGLLIKGKNGTNNPFVTIAVGKEKYQTSVKEKEGNNIIIWQEECELTIPKVGNTACVVLTALHKNGLGIDEFLGTVSIPLATFDVYERPKSRWYKLEGKPGKEKGKDKERGEVEVRIAFTVKAATGSLMDLSKKEKHKSSLGQISNVAHSVGGSLLSLGSIEKRQSIKKLAKTIGRKVSKKKRENGGDGESAKGSQENINQNPFHVTKNNVDPGVISEDEDEFTFDNLSHKSSGSSLGINNPALENLAGGEFLRRSTKSPPSKPPRTLPNTTAPTPLDEWDQKLYSRSSTLERGDTLKRSSFGSSFDSSKPETPDDPEPTSPFTFKSKEPEKQPNITISPVMKTKIEITSDEVKFDKAPEVKITKSEPVTNSPKPLARTTMTPSPKLNKPESPDINKEGKDMSTLARKFKHYSKTLMMTDKDKKDDSKLERYIVGEETSTRTEETSRHPQEILRRFEHKSRDDLIDIILELQKTIEQGNKHRKDLEDYLDILLLRVMETTPRILQNPFVTCKTEANKY